MKAGVDKGILLKSTGISTVSIVVFVSLVIAVLKWPEILFVFMFVIIFVAITFAIYAVLDERAIQKRRSEADKKRYKNEDFYI